MLLNTQTSTQKTNTQYRKNSQASKIAKKNQTKQVTKTNTQKTNTQCKKKTVKQAILQKKSNKTSNKK